MFPKCFLQDSASTSGSSSKAEEEEKLGEAVEIRDLLHQNTEEMRSIVRALNGEYIEPQAGGDLLRDGAGVLPTGMGQKVCRVLGLGCPAYTLNVICDTTWHAYLHFRVTKQGCCTHPYWVTQLVPQRKSLSSQKG